VGAAEAVSTARALGGAPVLAVRYSGGPVRLAWPSGFDLPDGLEEADLVDVSGWEQACAGLPLSHMGRGPDEDPAFFAAAFAAGRLLRTLV
jgi:hypothetical protein